MRPQLLPRPSPGGIPVRRRSVGSEDAGMANPEIRAAGVEEFPEFYRKLANVFGEPWRDEDIDRERAVFEADRSIVAVDRGRIVATTGAISFEVTVPGLASVPAAGVTYVGVQPTHRRRGVLTSMMAKQ